MCVVRVTKVWGYSWPFSSVAASEAALRSLRAHRYELTPFGTNFPPISLRFRSCKNPRSPFTETERWPIPAAGQKGRPGLPHIIRQLAIHQRGGLVTSSVGQATPLPLSSLLLQRFRLHKDVTHLSCGFLGPKFREKLLRREMSVVGVGGNGAIASWMDRIAVKRNDLKGRRQRNLRAEAILGHAQVIARRRLDVKWTEYKGDRDPRDHEAPNCGSICDCETCVLCQRHFYTGHARCYCNEVFNSGAMDAVEEDPEVCKKFEEFFAELDLVTKRKRDHDGDSGGRCEREAKRLRFSAS